MRKSIKLEAFMQAADEITYSEAFSALQSGSALLISRRAFSSEEETRLSYPPKPDATSGEVEAWCENARPWYEEQRHLFIACINPETSSLITSSADPDKSQTRWTVRFCSEEMPLTQLDKQICNSEALWAQYSASAVVLSPTDYPTERITEVIEVFRNQDDLPEYGIEPATGYDCQTATRDVLGATNEDIDPKTISLPPGTKVLAYYSDVTAELQESHGICCI